MKVDEMKEDREQEGRIDKVKDTEQAHAGKISWFEKFPNIKLSQNKKEKVAIIFLLGVFFLLVATPVSTFSKDEEEERIVDSQEKEIKKEEIGEKDAYIEQLENKLEQTIGGMEGTGNVIVMITLKDSGEKILDKNQPYESSSEKSIEEGRETEQSSIKNEQETVLIEEEGNTLPIIVQELYPDIEGVVVVCEGGDNSELALRIKEVVQALFSIDAHKIVVCK